MIKITVITSAMTETIETGTGKSLLDFLREHGYNMYAPCGGKGTCTKCRVNIKGEGIVTSCSYFPEADIDVILPGESEANILVNQTRYLEDLSLNCESFEHLSPNPYGVAIDIGTTTVVLYFLNYVTGQIEKIASMLNPQAVYGGDVISRINYCQTNQSGLTEIQGSIIRLINHELETFCFKQQLDSKNFARIVAVGNTTMLHFLLGEDPISIALAPFTPKFTERQIRKGRSIDLNIHPDADIVTLPCVSAYVGADIVAGISALVDINKNMLFIDIGTNGEMALITDKIIYTCSTAAGPAFEGANISCGMGAIAGAISGFTDEDNYLVIGGIDPKGFCGSGIVDIMAYLLQNEFIDETGLMNIPFILDQKNELAVTQQDVREIQLAKSAIYSGIKVLVEKAGISFEEIDALYLAGGFGNYINHESAIKIGLLPFELQDKTVAVGNSAGIGALQYLKSLDFVNKTDAVLKKCEYIELSNMDEFNMEFALNMNF